MGRGLRWVAADPPLTPGCVALHSVNPLLIFSASAAAISAAARLGAAPCHPPGAGGGTEVRQCLHLKSENRAVLRGEKWSAAFWTYSATCAVLQRVKESVTQHLIPVVLHCLPAACGLLR